MEEGETPRSPESLLPYRMSGDGLELLNLWQSAADSPELYFSCLATCEPQKNAAVSLISQRLNQVFGQDNFKLPLSTEVTEKNVIDVNVLIDKAINETGILGEVVLGGELSSDTDQWGINPRTFFGVEAEEIDRARSLHSSEEGVALHYINDLEPGDKLRLFEASQQVVDEYMETSQALVGAWAMQSLAVIHDNLDDRSVIRRDMRRPLAGCIQRAKNAEESETPEARREARIRLFQGVMKGAFAIADNSDPELVASPILEKAMQDLLYAVELYGQLKSDHTNATERFNSTIALFNEAQQAEAEEKADAASRAETELFMTRLGELPQELGELVDTHRLGTGKLKKEGLRQAYLDLESKGGLEREDARQLTGFIWLLRSSVARIGPEGTQDLLKADLNQEKIIYWLAEKITSRLGSVEADTLPPKAPLERMIEMARRHWKPLNAVLRRHAEPGVHLKSRLEDVEDVLFMRDFEEDVASDHSESELPSLTPEQARLQMVLLKAVADLYETAGIVDKTLLPEPVKAKLESAEKDVQDQSPILEDEQAEEGAEETESDTVEQRKRRHLLAKVDGGRISTLHALKQAYEGSEYFTEEIFLTGKDKLPYMAVVFEREGVTYAIAENPEIGNATYVYADVPVPDRGRVPWQKVYEANREDARILYDATQIKHPRGETTTDHMEEIIAALVAFGLPPKVANAARYTLRDLDRGADKPWVPSDLNALEAAEGIS